MKCIYEGLSTGQLRNVLTSERDRVLQRQKFGPCNLEVPKKSCWSVLVSEVLNPFYIFQMVNVLIWFYDHYLSYAILIIFISTFSVLVSLYETIKATEKVRRMALFDS